jgi:PAS domain S-box-containing protein
MRSEEGLLLLSGDGTILWANAAAGNLLGYSRHELSEMALPPMSAESASANSLGPVAQAFRDLLAGRAGETEGDARFPDKAEKRIAVHWKLSLLPAASGPKQILLALSETAQASPEGPITSGYRDVFEHAVEGIFRSTIGGQFLEVNPALARMYRYGSAAELMAAMKDIGTQLYVRPERRAEFVRRMQEQGFVSDFEAEVRTADGDTLCIAIFARTVRDEHGEALYFEGSVIDITERKRAETALRHSEERFRRLAETTRVVPFEFDRTTQRFVYLGPQVEALFGKTVRDGTNLETWMSLVHEEDRVEGALFAEEAAYDFQTEFRVHKAGGGVVWVKQIVHRGGEDDSPGLVRGFLFDITEVKDAEMERERSRGQLRALAARNQDVREEERASIAREIHDELGQALTLLKIDLAWLTGRLGTITPEEMREPLQEKITGMERMIHATLQTVRRILTSLRPPLLAELGLKDAIEFQTQEFSNRVGIRYELDVAPVRVFPPNSATGVFRIFQEILTNVARHAKASRIKVALHETDGNLVLMVEDNGCGISQESLRDTKRFGILGMQERAWALGGEVEMHRTSRAGTRVTLRVPLPDGKSDES